MHERPQATSVVAKVMPALMMAWSAGCQRRPRVRVGSGTHDAGNDAKGNPGVHGVVAFPLSGPVVGLRAEVAVPAKGEQALVPDVDGEEHAEKHSCVRARELLWI